MSTWAWVAFIGLVGCVSAALTYAAGRRAVANARAALEAERNNFKETAQAIEAKVRRAALDEFLADVRIEERHYVREHRLLFVHRKSLVVEERIFFRNIPLSNWVEHEVPVEEGADLDKLAQTLSVFDAVGSIAPPARPKPMLLEKLGL